LSGSRYVVCAARGHESTLAGIKAMFDAFDNGTAATCGRCGRQRENACERLGSARKKSVWLVIVGDTESWSIIAEDGIRPLDRNILKE
jgi:predicted PP-loop superfamily ATPase